jgi:hypothetical protein
MNRFVHQEEAGVALSGAFRGLATQGRAVSGVDPGTARRSWCVLVRFFQAPVWRRRVRRLRSIEPQQLKGVLAGDLAAVALADRQAVKPVVLLLDRLIRVVDGIENPIRPTSSMVSMNA